MLEEFIKFRVVFVCHSKDMKFVNKIIDFSLYKIPHSQMVLDSGSYRRIFDDNSFANYSFASEHAKL